MTKKTEFSLRKQEFDKDNYWRLQHLSTTAFALAGFSFTALSVFIGFFRQNLGDASGIISVLLACTALYVISAEMAREAYQVAKFLLAETTYMFATALLLSSFLLFVSQQAAVSVSPIVYLPLVLAVGYLGWRAVHNIYVTFRASKPTGLKDGSQPSSIPMGPAPPQEPSGTAPSPPSLKASTANGQTEDNLRGYIDRKLRFGKLDSALLFLSSSVGLVFAVTQSLIRSPTSLVAFAPVFLLGWALPFYYGYMKGGLVTDSIIDRFRGWTYFVGGLGVYFLIVISSRLLDILAPNPASTSLAPSAVGMTILFIMFTGLFVMRAFTRFLFRLASERFTVVTYRVGLWTGMTGMFVAFVGWYATLLQTFTIFSFIFFAPLAVLAVYCWDKSDYYARAASAHILHGTKVSHGWLYSNRFVMTAKLVVQYSTYAILGITSILLLGGIGFGWTVLYAGLVFLFLYAILVFFTRTRNRIEFERPPRRSRKEAIVDTIRRTFSGPGSTPKTGS